MVLAKWILGIIAVISLIITFKSLYTLIVSKESLWKKFKSVLLTPFTFIYTLLVTTFILFLPLYLFSALALTSVEEFIGKDDEESPEKTADDIPAICKEDPSNFSDEAIEAIPEPNLEYLAEGSSVSVDYDKYRAEEEEYMEKIKEMYNKQSEYDSYCVNHPRNEYPDGYDPSPDDSGTNDPYIYWVDEYYREDGTQV